MLDTVGWGVREPGKLDVPEVFFFNEGKRGKIPWNSWKIRVDRADFFVELKRFHSRVGKKSSARIRFNQAGFLSSQESGSPLRPETTRDKAILSLNFQKDLILRFVFIFFF